MKKSDDDDWPNLGDRVTFCNTDGSQHSGTVTTKVSVGDLRSYDVQVGTGEPQIVSPKQIIGHPLHEQGRSSDSRPTLKRVS